jgi:hypothetical protein
VARDANFASYSIGLLPSINTPPDGVPTPNRGNTQTALAPGNAWSLDTTNMKVCGYVIQVTAADLAIVNSQWTGRNTSASAGFCLDASGEDC